MHATARALYCRPRVGKTTLIAYLLSQGYDYLADDLIALSAPEGRIVPWPLPLSIKAGSWGILSKTYCDLPRFPQYRTQRGNARQLVPPAQAWDTDPVPLHGVVFPRYVAGAAATLTQITPLEAFGRLLDDKIWLGYPITEQRVYALLAQLKRVPAFTLRYGRLDQALPCIKEALAH